MIEEFKKYLLNESLSENTYNSYLNDMEKFIIYYTNKYDEEFTTFEHPDIITYINDLKKEGVNPSTINRRLSALKKYNEFLIEKNLKQKIEIRQKDYIKFQGSIITEDLPEPKEISKIKHAIYKESKNPKRDYCAFILLTNGGFRESELINIKIADIHLKERWIDIIGKGNKFRQVIINNEMYDSLQEYLEERKQMNINNYFLFVGQKTKNNNKSLNRNFCNRLLDKYKSYCKNCNLHPHLLRSLFCSNTLHNAGYTIDQVANQAGHSSLNTTKKYLKFKKEDLLELANRQ